VLTSAPAQSERNSAHPDTWRFAALKVFLVVGILYSVGAEMAWGLFGAGEAALAFFPPAGLTVADLILLPRRQWFPVTLAIFVAESSVNLRHGLDPGISMSYGITNVVEPLVGAQIVCMLLAPRPSRSLDLHRGRDTAAFVAGPMMLGPIAGALIGATVYGWQEPSDWLVSFAHWWVGDALGVLCVSAPILAFAHQRPNMRRRDIVEAVGILTGTLVVSILVLWVSDRSFVYLILPLLLWSAFRFGLVGVGVASFVCAITVNLATKTGHGYFASLTDSSAQTRLGLTQLFLAVTIITAWIFAIEIDARVVAEQGQVRERDTRVRAEGMLAAGDLSSRLGAAATTNEMIEILVDHVRDRLGAHGAMVNDVDVDVATGASAANDTDMPPVALSALATIPRGVDLPGSLAAVTGEAVWIETSDALETEFPGLSSVVGSVGIGALVALPLGIHAGRRGYLVVVWTESRSFDSNDRTHLRALAGVAAQAFDRAKAFEEAARTRVEVERTAARLASLQQATAGFAAAVSTRDVMSVAAHQARTVVGATAVWVLLLDPTGARLVSIGDSDPDESARPSLEFPIALDSPSRAAFLTGQTVVVESRDDFSLRFPDAPPLYMTGHFAWALMPFHLGSRETGLLRLAFPSARTFRTEEVSYMEAMSDLCGQAIERVTRQAAEHDAVSQLQRNLLPHSVNSSDYVAVSACYRPAGTAIAVGGDWYDTIPLAGQAVMLIVGDVVGRGVSAALAMGQLRSAARALGQQLEPAELLHALDRFVADVDDGHFTTLACVIVDPLANELRYSIAGHPPPLVRDTRGNVRELTGGRAQPLGAARGVRPQATEPLHGVSLLVLYTDGLVERRCEVIDVGIDRVATAMLTIDETAPGWCEELIDSCIDETALHDDIAVLGAAISRHPVTLRIGLGRDLSSLGESRATMRLWLQHLGITGEELYDVILAIGEAASNALQYGNVTDERPAVIELSYEPPGALIVVVTDNGVWYDRPLDDPSGGGRGLSIMGTLMGPIDVTRSPSGTSVRLQRLLQGDRND